MSEPRPPSVPAQEPPQPDLPPAPPVGATWFRLDPRMLLVHPVREVLRFLPALVLLALAGSGPDGGVPWQLLGVVVPIVIGLLRYLTTSFRIADGRVELRTGLVMRRARSARLERVRTVDLSASLIHRVLDLSTVRIGTGTNADDQQLELDGLRSAGALRLRDDLLRSSPAAPTAPTAPTAPGAPAAAAAGPPTDLAQPDGPADPTAPAPPLLVLDPRWARYAPLTSTGVVVLAGILGAGAQVLQSTDELLPDAARVADDPGLPGLVTGLVLLGVALAATAVLAVIGYLTTNWGLTLRRSAGSWQLRRGLITTRDTSIDEERLAGVRLHEPLSLRLVGAARLSAVVTGLAGSQAGSALIVPPAPARVAGVVAGEVLGAPALAWAPVEAHGPAATRRRWTRALGPAAVLAAGAVLLTLLLDLAPWLLLVAPLVLAGAALLAADRARTLGHAHVEHHVVARSGSVVRRRDTLADEHVIGWNLRATWFQRRVGLTTLSATTAGGPQAVTVLDVPEGRAVALAHAVLPDVVGQFLDPPTSRAEPGTRTRPR